VAAFWVAMLAAYSARWLIACSCLVALDLAGTGCLAAKPKRATLTVAQSAMKAPLTGSPDTRPKEQQHTDPQRISWFPLTISKTFGTRRP
jgi:hypothetical protein